MKKEIDVLNFWPQNSSNLGLQELQKSVENIAKLCGRTSCPVSQVLFREISVIVSENLSRYMYLENTRNVANNHCKTSICQSEPIVLEFLVLCVCLLSSVTPERFLPE